MAVMPGEQGLGERAMGRWGVVVECMLLAACGSRTERSAGAGIVEGAAPGGGPGATDGGGGEGPSCMTGSLIANAGGGSACGVKPVLGSPRTVHVPLQSADGSDGGVPISEECKSTPPSDGEGLIIARTALSFNDGTPSGFLSAFDMGGNRIDYAGFAAVGLTGAEAAFPLSGGWLVAVFTGPPSDAAALFPFFPPTGSRPSVFIGDSPFAFARAPSGGVAAAATFPTTAGTPCPAGPSGPRFRMFLERFDASATLLGPFELGCVDGPGTEIGLGENAAGNVIVLLPDGGWHLAPDGTLTTFPSTTPGTLLPLVDGQFAKKEGGAWTATVAPDGTVSPPPCWLATRPEIDRFQIVLDGGAYLAFHRTSCDDYAELILPDGTSCGPIPISGTDGTCSPDVVSVGLDGTLTTLDLRSCTLSAWDQAFR
jgi:hypothetical protein